MPEMIIAPVGATELPESKVSTGDVTVSPAKIAERIGLFGIKGAVVDRTLSASGQINEGYYAFEVRSLRVDDHAQEEVLDTLTGTGWDDASYKATVVSTTWTSVEQAALIDPSTAGALVERTDLHTELRIRKRFTPQFADSLEGEALRTLMNPHGEENSSPHFLVARINTANPSVTPELFLVRGDYNKHFDASDGLDREENDEVVGLMEFTALPDDEKEAIKGLDIILHTMFVDKLIVSESNGSTEMVQSQ